MNEHDDEDAFKINGYLVIRNILEKQTIELIKTQILMHEKQKCIENNKLPTDFILSDFQCPLSASFYGLLCAESLLTILQPIIEKKINMSLYPTYSFTRIYYKNSVLKPHTDRESCEISATICITNEEKPWDIYFLNRQNEEICITLYPGDAIIYMGMELKHWREKYNHARQIQTFLHYVNANGKYTEHKYDKRICLGYVNI